MESLSSGPMFTYWAGQVGIAVFAVTGVLAAGHRNLDLFAVV
ncbi:MAG: trimeric intracellular cation channel family protein, partial [Betaproteobacteria bacterium]|nr:trimeric intracellular cation channel family protein [Betaproteobacteria bacterium]